MTKKETQKTKKEKGPKIEITSTECRDKDCPTHGNLKLRGRTFKGFVVSKHDKRIAIEFERMIYLRKYERYAKTKTKLHARLPKCMEKEVNIGDLVQIKECRPLSKMIHSVVIQIIRKAGGEIAFLGKINGKEKE
nr:30S ribosomal protein S17P [uncultured archaeon]